MKPMKRVLLLIFLLSQVSIFLHAQHGTTMEIQAVIEDTNSDIQLFINKFNEWIDSGGNNTPKLKGDELSMVNNFIIFSEDGIIMKDLNFHSVESCKNQIITCLPKSIEKFNEVKWIYVSQESHVNKSELIQILAFLREKKINYRFGDEDEFVPNIIADEH